MRAAAWASLLTAIIGLACSSSTDTSGDPPPQPTFGPMVTGLNVMAENGQQVSVWRTPSEHPSASGDENNTTDPLIFRSPFPCPFLASVTISFLVRRPGSVHVWIAHARLSGATGHDTMAVRCGGTGTPDSIVVRRIIDATIPAGRHDFWWDGNDDCGEPVPPGFYRIFATYDGSAAVLWRDVLLYRSPNDSTLKLVRSGG